MPNGALARQILHARLEHIQAADPLRLICMTRGPGSPPQPRFPSDIGNDLFPALPPAEREAAAGGLLGGICDASTQGTALLPVRAHLFFRNLQGLWVCSDSQCAAVTNRTAPRPVVRLHYTQPLTLHGV